MAVWGNKTSITVQTASRVSDGQGGFTDTWNDTETVRALLHPMRKDESLLYSKNTNVPFFNCWMSGKSSDRTIRTITTDQRIKVGTRIFNILFVGDQFEANNILKLDLQELTNVS